MQLCSKTLILLGINMGFHTGGMLPDVQEFLGLQDYLLIVCFIKMTSSKMTSLNSADVSMTSSVK